MNCPICNVTLQIADKQGVEIDYCPKCRGIWLDRGELDKIIERSFNDGFGPSTDRNPKSRNYDDNDKRYHSHDRDKYGRKRNFLSDIFDF